MFGIYQQRITYWANSKPVQALREKFGPKKPIAATMEDWDAYHDEWERIHPTLDYLTDDFVDLIQNICYFPYDLTKHLLSKFNARFIDRYYLAESELNKWEYHEIDTRMLFINFAMLVEFVEVERAWSYVVWNDAEKEFGVSWYHRNLFTKHFCKWRNYDAGYVGLLWESNLKYDESYYGDTKEAAMEHFGEKYGQPTEQALKAKETLDLYYWWSVVRPNRPDPDEVSGVKAMIALEEKNGKFRFKMNGSPEYRAAFNKATEIQEQYEKEDEEMLVRLIKHRNFMWT